jgi:hypothetical protein
MSAELIVLAVLVYLAVLGLALAVLTAAKRGDEAQRRYVRRLTDPETGAEPPSGDADDGVEERRRAG